MASRRRAREFALQALYQIDVSDCSARAALEATWSWLLDGDDDTRPAESEEIEFTNKIVEGVVAQRDELDALIEKASVNWRLSRMPIVDRNILRMAAFELVATPDVPVSVCINEAVELAKQFGEKESRAFVNGILDRIAFETGRGGRKHLGS
ncbi:MAG: transcription antitermination factor NusB [Myxococcota bacterium]|jgi:N utilization substance protein B|nr:transcription antitermination factor NusB [Myxococcota bacterium]